MKKRRLYVFAGKPGAGKTTIINKIFSKGEKIVDVLPFVEQFRVGKKVLEHKTITAYENMYEYLKKIKDSIAVLEIGMNHPELNISEIEKLQDEYEVTLFLCETS